MPETNPETPERKGNIQALGLTKPVRSESDATLDAADEAPVEPAEQLELDAVDPLQEETSPEAEDESAEEVEEATAESEEDEIFRVVTESLQSPAEAPVAAAPDVEMARREGALSEREKYLNEQISRLGKGQEKAPEEEDEFEYLKSPVVAQQFEQMGLDPDVASALPVLVGQLVKQGMSKREATLRAELAAIKEQSTIKESQQENQRQVLQGLSDAARMGGLEKRLVKDAMEGFQRPEGFKGTLVGQKLMETLQAYQKAGIKIDRIPAEVVRDAVASTARMMEQAYARQKAAPQPSPDEAVEEVVEAGSARTKARTPAKQAPKQKLTPEEEILQDMDAVRSPSENIPFLRR